MASPKLGPATHSKWEQWRDRAHTVVFGPFKSPSEEIAIYQHDLLMSFVEGHKLKTWQLLLGFFSLFVVAKFVMAHVADVLWMPNGAIPLSLDIDRFAPFRLLMTAIFKAAEAPPAPNPPFVPYARDYADIVIGTLMAFHMVLMRNQWRRISLAYHQLWEKGVLRRSVISEITYNRLREKYQRWFGSRVWRFLTILLGIFLVDQLSSRVSSQGIYPSLNLPPNKAWQALAYSHWWANPVQHPILHLYWFLVEVLICTYFFRHIVVGVLAVFLCYETFKQPKPTSEPESQRQTEPILKLCPTHTDETGGVRILRQIMYRVFLSIMIGSFAFLMLYYCFGAVWEVDAVCALYLACNPFFIIPPLWIVARHVSAAKHYEIERIETDIQDAANNKDAAKVQVLQDKILLYSKVPDCLFSTHRLVTFAVEYLVPVIGFLHDVHQKVVKT